MTTGTAIGIGSDSITTLGVVTTGTWNASLIALAYGGTNANLTASNGGIFYSTATAGAILAGTATARQMLQSGATAAPAWSTSTWPATTTINQILYSSAANVVGEITAVNSATLATSSSGVPSLVALGETQTLVGVSGGTPAAAYIPGRNRVVNGDFQIWQRGAGGNASFAITGPSIVYTADRWQVQPANLMVSTVTQTAGATSGSYLCRVQRNAGDTTVGPLQMATSLTRDMCIGMAGSVLTLSFKVACGANFSSAGNILSALVYTGTGSTDVSGINSGFTGSTNVINYNPAITTTLTNYTSTSAAVGSTVTQAVIVFVYTTSGTAGANDWFQITDVQLEVSPVQTPFERKNFAQQLADCQRFYTKSFVYSTAPAQNVGAGTGEQKFVASRAAALTERSSTFTFPVLMLAAPTLTTYNPAAANAEVYDLDFGGDLSATATNVQARGFTISATGNAGTTVGNQLGVHWTADADVT